jgi:hypothetical protein
MSTPTEKPKRPFGVTLAILMCILLFAILPSLTVFLHVTIQQHVQSNNTFILPDGTEINAVSGGDDDLKIDRTTLYQQTAISVVVIILAIFAWRGKPSWIRFVFIGIVFIISAILIYQNFLLFESNPLEGGTGQTWIEFLSNSNILFLICLPIYVIWYFNRAPSRAFYRGYYLQEELDWLKQQELDE